MTQNHVSGMEASAVSVLKRAVELDQGGRFQEALVCYQEGIQLLLDALKGFPPPLQHVPRENPNPAWYGFCLVSPAVKDDSKKGHYRNKVKGYMERAEQVKAHVLRLKEGNRSPSGGASPEEPPPAPHLGQNKAFVPLEPSKSLGEII